MVNTEFVSTSVLLQKVSIHRIPSMPLAIALFHDDDSDRCISSEDICRSISEF
jgi:hypothetical protein